MPDADTVTRTDGLVAHKQCPEPASEAAAHPIGGGAHDSPWTIVFDRRAARRDGDRAAFAELIAASREVVSHARDVRARSRGTRARFRDRSTAS